MKLIVLLFLVLLTVQNARTESSHNNEIPEKPVFTTFNTLVIEGTQYFAISYKTVPHWHTYWINPGDAGLPTKIEPQNFTIKELEWPAPKRYIEKGDILAYGYEGEYTRFFKAEDLPADGNLHIISTWLVCKHICIPGKVDIKANYNDGKLSNNSSTDFSISDAELKNRFEKLPKLEAWPNHLDIVLQKSETENQLVLHYNTSNPAKGKPDTTLSMLTPFRKKLVDIQREKLYQNKTMALFGKMSIGWDGEYMEPPVPFPADGKFDPPLKLKFLWNEPGTGRTAIIEKEFSTYDTNPSKAMTSLYEGMTFIAPTKPGSDNLPKHTEEEQSEVTSTQMSSQGLFYYLIFAFIGGLILNIMPCVLPVISLKLFGLVVHSDESKSKVFKHNLFYSLGVFATFIILAIVIVSFKHVGQEVGWGFQLQSPIFVASMIAILFIFSLNLFGLFEFITPGGKSLGNIELKKGVIGDFFSGVLATILSTPCSAPFLGTALTFAFTESSLTIFLVFMAIAFGLSFPFILIGLFPSSIKFLPRPGMWMDHVKKVLGLTMLLTVLWLIDVFLSLTDGGLPLLKLNTTLLMLFFAFYFQKNISKRNGYRLVLFAIPSLLFLNLVLAPMSMENGNLTANSLINEKNQHSNLVWEKWTHEKMDEYKNQQETVFIDFTAKWCLTCKVNEKLVLETSSFQELVQEKNVKLLLGDWTKYDPIIGKFLKSHGLVGVPAYFIQKPNGELINLGETISISEIESYL